MYNEKLKLVLRKINFKFIQKIVLTDKNSLVPRITLN